MSDSPQHRPDELDPPITADIGEIEDNVATTNSGATEGRATSPKDAEARDAAVKREKYRVRFNSNADARQPQNQQPSHTRDDSGSGTEASRLPIPRPRPSVLRTNSASSVPSAQDEDEFDPDPKSEKAVSAVAAQQRANRIASRVRKDSVSPSRDSFDSQMTAATSDGELLPGSSDDIPLRGMNEGTSSHPDGATHDQAEGEPKGRGEEDELHRGESLREQAYKLVRSHTQRFSRKKDEEEGGDQDTEAKTQQEHVVPSEVNDGSWDGVYNVPAPQEYRGSVLSQLLKLYKPATDMKTGHRRNSSNLSLPQSDSGGHSREGNGSGSAGTTTPNRKKWYEQNRSQDTLANLIEASARLANPNAPTDTSKSSPGKKWTRPLMHKRRTSSNSRMSAFLQQEEARITVHIAETLSRQEYIIKLCRALMLYGAPTHRLEEYLSMTARVLEIDGQFLYLPGCMVISFDDRSTHTTEVRIVRSAQGIDLGKLKDVHRIYKEVMHDVVGVEEGTERLDALMQSKDKFNAWLRVLVFGLTSAMSAPFSFKARLIDLPLSFCFGCLVGFLQLIASPKSKLYSNVFEVSAVVLVSFLARAFGSIAGGDLFCFSALAQSGIVLLLPGYLVLCSALELQSRAIVPGSIRIVYAIIYSLLLGFGITVGASLYGLVDSNATSATKCDDAIPSYYGFIFVPPFILCISILYQAKWRQMPMMVVIAFAGYIVNFFSTQRFSASPQIANTLGALSVGLLANLYSRLQHGVAAATLIPAIFTQVPGGLASTGGLLSGLNTANMLTGSNSTNPGQPDATSNPEGTDVNAVVFNVAASMIQIAIGIAVGLFISALIIYPLGKRRSGLFSF